jgi:hypothetical protein
VDPEIVREGYSTLGGAFLSTSERCVSPDSIAAQLRARMCIYDDLGNPNCYLKIVILK